MAESNLIATTRVVRRYALYFGVFIMSVIVLQWCLNTAAIYWKSRQPLPAGATYYLPIDNGYGNLVLNSITSIPVNKSVPPVYSMDNRLGDILDKGVNVYKIEEPVERFDTEGNAVSIARSLGFLNQYTRVDTTLTWQNGSATLTFNKVSQVWKLRNIGLTPGPKFTGFSADTNIYLNQAKSLLKQLGFKNSRLDLENLELDYLIKKSNSFTNANSPATAQYIKIRAYRQFEAQSLRKGTDGKTHPAVPKDTQATIGTSYKTDYLFKAPLEVIFTANQPETLSKEFIVSLDYTDWEFSSTPGVYSLLTPTEAWEQVKQGNGALRELTEIGQKRLDVGSIPNQEVLSFTASYQDYELAYIEPDTWSATDQYILPIYIFRGTARLANSPTVDNAKFVYYVYALKTT